MSDAKFTPGPWDWVTCSFPTTSMKIVEPRASIISQETHKNIATLEYEKSAEETNANARLIAAAPDMYEALEKIKYALENLGNGLPNNDFLAPYFLVIRAINKAKGETNE